MSQERLLNDLSSRDDRPGHSPQDALPTDKSEPPVSSSASQLESRAAAFRFQFTNVYRPLLTQGCQYFVKASRTRHLRYKEAFQTVSRNDDVPKHRVASRLCSWILKLTGLTYAREVRGDAMFRWMWEKPSSCMHAVVKCSSRWSKWLSLKDILAKLSAEIRHAHEWSVGKHVTCGGRRGFLLTKPNLDNKVRIRWDDGAMSENVHVSTLAETLLTDWTKVQKSMDIDHNQPSADKELEKSRCFWALRLQIGSGFTSSCLGCCSSASCTTDHVFKTVLEAIEFLRSCETPLGGLPFLGDFVRIGANYGFVDQVLGDGTYNVRCLASPFLNWHVSADQIVIVDKASPLYIGDRVVVDGLEARIIFACGTSYLLRLRDDCGGHRRIVACAGSSPTDLFTFQDDPCLAHVASKIIVERSIQPDLTFGDFVQVTGRDARLIYGPDADGDHVVRFLHEDTLQGLSGWDDRCNEIKSWLKASDMVFIRRGPMTCQPHHGDIVRISGRDARVVDFFCLLSVRFLDDGTLDTRIPIDKAEVLKSRRRQESELRWQALGQTTLMGLQELFMIPLFFVMGLQSYNVLEKTVLLFHFVLIAIWNMLFVGLMSKFEGGSEEQGAMDAVMCKPAFASSPVRWSNGAQQYLTSVPAFLDSLTSSYACGLAFHTWTPEEQNAWNQEVSLWLPWASSVIGCTPLPAMFAVALAANWAFHAWGFLLARKDARKYLKAGSISRYWLALGDAAGVGNLAIPSLIAGAIGAGMREAAGCRYEKPEKWRQFAVKIFLGSLPRQILKTCLASAHLLTQNAALYATRQALAISFLTIVLGIVDVIGSPCPKLNLTTGMRFMIYWATIIATSALLLASLISFVMATKCYPLLVQLCDLQCVNRTEF